MKRSYSLSRFTLHYHNLDDGGNIRGLTSLATADSDYRLAENTFPASDPHQEFKPEQLSVWLRREKLSADALAVASQVHGAAVCYAGNPAVFPGVDALYTDLPGLPLGIRTADCAAVIISFPRIPAVGIAHAGWRGAAGKIVSNLVDAMLARWPENPAAIRVAVSPHIRKCCYQVGAEFPDIFPEHLLPARQGRLYFDLEMSLREELRVCGIPAENVTIPPFCTACSPIPLYSYRRNKTARRLLSVVEIMHSEKGGGPAALRFRK